MNSSKVLLQNKRSHAFTVFMAVLVALFPKCPLCWAAYASGLSMLGIAGIPYYGWILPLIIGLLFIHLVAQGIAARRRKLYVPFILSLMGGGIILLGKLWMNDIAVVCIGVALIVISSLWSILTKKSGCESMRRLY